jgi:uncharacterized protein with HEPN domain
MTLQIRCISIYSHTGERRDVNFKLNALNIVTGQSKTGKSTLLDIVDYCWGRNECTIAEGEIRKSVSWFAVHFDHKGEGVLIARKNPGPAGRASDEIFVGRGVEVLPDNHERFHKNVTSEGLKSQLSSILGIAENIHIPAEGSTRQPLEASARHAILFCLQAQDEIANRRLLFHRQSEQFFPPAIRDALPYFFGAVDENHFLTLKRYQDARARLRKLDREYIEIQSLTQNASNSILSLLQEAQRAGLITDHIVNLDTREALQILRNTNTPKGMDFTHVVDSQSDLATLDQKRRQHLSEFQDIREEINDVQRLSQETSEFEAEAKEQEARLASIGLIGEESAEAQETCPLCENHLAVPIPTVSEIKKSLSDVQIQLKSVRRDAPRLQERIAVLEKKREDVSESLRSVQREIAQRIQDNERLRMQQNQFAEQARVAGRIAYYLENASSIAQESDLPRQIEKLKAEIDELEKALDDNAAESRLATALNLLGRDLTDYATQLNLEHSDNPLRLDLKNLTVVADTDDGPLSLSQMGSAENWVGYHVVAYLALHRLFRKRSRPVPGFVMLDQPSQAHYPPERDMDKIDDMTDKDQLAVHQLFKFIYRYTSEFNKDIQIIITDHVELLDDWFRESIAERWRDGIALVPVSWTKS